MRRETEVAIGAAAVAQRIADSREGADQVTSKGGIDLVTATDVACEDAVRAELSAAFPAYAIVGEERGGSPAADAPYWLVDPICGTRPFASDVPLYCSNIALVEADRVTVAVVACGRSGEIVYAERGEGAWMRKPGGDRRLRATDLSDIIWINGKGARAATVVRRALLADRWYVWMFSSTLSYAYLATGRIAGILHFSCTPLHTAAGCLIAAESGAVVTDLEGAAWTLASRSFVAAATPAMHRALCDLIN
jgi:myo-inositol-1(or 4)-monophosphatase